MSDQSDFQDVETSAVVFNPLMIIIFRPPGFSLILWLYMVIKSTRQIMSAATVWEKEGMLMTSDLQSPPKLLEQ